MSLVMIYIYVASLLDLQEGPNRTYFPGCCVVLSGKGVIPVQAFNRPQYLNRRFIMRSTLPSKLSKFLVALFFVSSMSVSFFAFTGVALAHSTAATTTTTNCVLHNDSSMVEMGLGPSSESSIAL